MRKWNKLLALVLAMVMVFGLTATAFAAENEDSGETAPVTDTEPAEGETDPDAAPAEGEADPDAAPADGEADPDAAPADGEADPDAAPADGEADPDAAPADGEGEDAEDPDAAEPAYTDVEGRWFSEAVNFVLEKGLMDGATETTFAPDANVTRQVLVVALYRMAGSPAVAEDAVNPFTDVAEDAPYRDAVVWANANEVVTGVTETTFAPDADVKRQEIAAILYRYVKSPAVESTDLSKFNDADSVQSWAVDAVAWAVANGVLNGTTDGDLRPRETARRSEIATILKNYMENLLPAEGEDATEPAEGEEAAEPTEGEDAGEPTEGEETTEPAEGEGEGVTEPAEGETDGATEPAEGETEGEEKTEE